MTRQQQQYTQDSQPIYSDSRLEMNNYSETSETQPGDKTNDRSSSSNNNNSSSSSNQWVVANVYISTSDDIKNEDEDEPLNESLIDRAWSRRILGLIGNKARLLESFSWLSTVGGGFSALGERDLKFSARAGALSLGQQLRLAELLGDERLKVMCHLFGALAALQLNNKQFCLNYIKRVIIPLINAMPYQDPILINILRHICFRMSMMDNFAAARNNAIENNKEE